MSTRQVWITLEFSNLTAWFEMKLNEKIVLLSMSIWLFANYLPRWVSHFESI